MAKLKKGEIIELDGEGNPEGALPPGSNNPADFADELDTDAGRKAADMYWQLLGTPGTDVGYLTVTYHAEGRGERGVSVARYPADKYTLDELIEDVRAKHAQKLHPGKEGDYRFLMWGKSARGNNKLIGNKLVSILAGDSGSALPAVASGVDPVIANLIRDMRADQQRLQEQIAELSKAKDTDWKGALLALAPIATPLFIAWMNRPKDDPMKALTTALALTGTIRDARAENDAPPDDAPWWAPALLQGFQGVTHALATRGALAPPALPPGAGAASQAPAGDPTHPAYEQVTALCGVAGRADPDECAEQVWGQMPEAMRGPLVAFLTAPDAFKSLIRINPEVLNNVPWWVDFCAALQDLSQPPHTADQSVTGGGSDSGIGSDTGGAGT